MKNCESACFSVWATIGCTISGPEDFNAQAKQLAATIRKNFEELGV